jgi:hypothetical protein
MHWSYRRRRRFLRRVLWGLLPSHDPWPIHSSPPS